ncbi:hypothetical protein [Ferroplasma acidiphilum]|jgi:hypothetical protein|uniref:Uncharacterized protein n=1 Tax=Ferroplasma acidiphilum TaxID=74969 RepID=A0A1V0N2A9_9ARCH|nr:hypothetical protein [Ferroplasma acidiphilum]ARD84292.1 hypothetical protein FAD_0371 [Ferroplasma acidiphilum]MCL4348621.1 hypothetical protein [Candidatus Thermoplasmatota archaeon]WMT53197.1 MAG: hypothetical protein RE473_09345 [Ferroplasma acidiphilum]
MNVDDQREVICGGDPDNYLKAYLKGLYFDLDDGQEIKVIFSSEKFPFNNEKFSEMVKAAKLKLLNYSGTEDTKTLIIKK